MMTSVLPLISPEKGAQLGFVAQGMLLVVSGVYYPVDVLPTWMEWISVISPATYALDGIRDAILERGGPLDDVGRALAAARDRRRLGPDRALGLPTRGDLREEAREAEALRLAPGSGRRGTRRSSATGAARSGQSATSRPQRSASAAIPSGRTAFNGKSAPTVRTSPLPPSSAPYRRAFSTGYQPALPIAIAPTSTSFSSDARREQERRRTARRSRPRSRGDSAARRPVAAAGS